MWSWRYLPHTRFPRTLNIYVMVQLFSFHIQSDAIRKPIFVIYIRIWISNKLCKYTLSIYIMYGFLVFISDSMESKLAQAQYLRGDIEWHESIGVHFQHRIWNHKHVRLFNLLLCWCIRLVFRLNAQIIKVCGFCTSVSQKSHWNAGWHTAEHLLKNSNVKILFN